MKNITTDTVILVNGEKTKIGAWLKQYAKEKGYKVFKTAAAQLSPNDFAKLLFDYAISGNDPDDELMDYFGDIAEIAAVIEDGIASVKSSNKAEAVQKKNEQQVDKANESAQLAKVTTFGDSLKSGAESTKEATMGFLVAIKESFPESIKLGASGQVTISKDASVEDVGKAFGAAIQFDQTTKIAGNMLSFVIGELTNAAVEAGVYPTKKACAADIAERLEKAKVKSLSVSAIENFSRMAERIPVDKRNDEVPATVYQTIACVKQPKQKDGESNAEFKKRKEKYQSQVDSILDAVQSGEVTEVKDVKKLIDKLQKSSELKEATYTMGDFMKIFIEASMLMTLVGKDGTLALIAGTDGDSIELTRDELKEIAKSALSHYINMKNLDPKADLEVSQLTAGYISSTGAK